jgi:hypothetical protein
MKGVLIPLLICLPLSLSAGDSPDKTRWWEKRHQQKPELYFPHKAHDKAMESSGVTCLACHPFNAVDESDPEQVARMAVIANEPLEAICHSCHVEDRSAPAECTLCHPSPEKIWPGDHDFDYVRLHGFDAIRDEKICQSCHLDLNYCIDCHFRRDAGVRREHGVGYRLSHGLEARMDPQKCGSCHNPSYCFDCHREIGP